MLDKIKLGLAGWSIKTFAGKYLRRGLRVGVSLLVGKVLAPATLAKVNGITASIGLGPVDPATVELALDGLVWTKLETLANLAKVKAERSDNFQWVGKLL